MTEADTVSRTFRRQKRFSTAPGITVREVHFDNMRMNSGALVFRVKKKKLEILLVHQSDKHKNVWSIPKGGVEPDEEYEQAARREVEEETNVVTEHLDFLGYVNYGKAQKRLYCYMGECPENVELRIKTPEIDNAGFFEISQAKKMVDKRQRPLLTALQRIIAFDRIYQKRRQRDTA